MSYYLYLVETKKEYTIHLVNVLAPLMYEGIFSIYEDAKNNAPDGEELRLFQNLLRKIPSWNEHLIEQETKRILKVSSKGSIIEDLIKAVIKSNIMILTNTPPDKKDNLRINHDISTQKFIHNSYMEIARNIFQNPYLFYHKYNSFELKKNQRDSTDIIKKSISQCIRKLLPMNLVLQNYLGNTFDNQIDDFDNPIPDSDYNNLRNMLNKDPTINNDLYTLINKNDNITKLQPTLPPTQQSPNNDLLKIKINIPKTKTNINSSENFMALKELTKQNISPIENKTNKILLDKTEQAIKNSENKTNKILLVKTEQTIKDSENKTNKILLAKESENKTNIKININSEPVKQILFNSTKIINNDTEGDESISYFKQFTNKEEIAEIYDNNATKLSPKHQSTKSQNNDKTFINYDQIMNNDSSVNLKSIINDISSIDRNKNKSLTGNKKKYFNNNSIL